MEFPETRTLIVDKRHADDEYGVVMFRDIARGVLAQNRSASRTNIYEVMSKPVISVHPEMDVRYCVQLFDSFGLSRAPVLENGKIIGLVSYTDIVLKSLQMDAEEHGEDHSQLLGIVGAAHAAGGEDDHAKEPRIQTPGDGAIYIGDDNHVLHDAHEVPKWVKLSPFIAMLIGFLTAYQFYIRRPDLPAKLAESQAPLYNFLLNKWYFDEIYDFVFVKPAMWVGKFLWKKGDGATIDGSINGLAMGVIPFFTRLAGRAQSGYIFTYAFWMVVGIGVLITWMTISGGAE